MYQNPGQTTFLAVTSLYLLGTQVTQYGLHNRDDFRSEYSLRPVRCTSSQEGSIIQAAWDLGSWLAPTWASYHPCRVSIPRRKLRRTSRVFGSLSSPLPSR